MDNLRWILDFLFTTLPRYYYQGQRHFVSPQYMLKKQPQKLSQLA